MNCWVDWEDFAFDEEFEDNYPGVHFVLTVLYWLYCSVKSVISG